MDKEHRKRMSEKFAKAASEVRDTLAEGCIVEKAYKIDLDKLHEGYLSDTITCHAETVNKAKKELLKRVRYDDWKLKYSNEKLTYLNIPVIRNKTLDLVIFEGKKVFRYVSCSHS